MTSEPCHSLGKGSPTVFHVLVRRKNSSKEVASSDCLGSNGAGGTKQGEMGKKLRGQESYAKVSKGEISNDASSYLCCFTPTFLLLPKQQPIKQMSKAAFLGFLLKV